MQTQSAGTRQSNADSTLRTFRKELLLAAGIAGAGLIDLLLLVLFRQALPLGIAGLLLFSLLLLLLLRLLSRYTALIAAASSMHEEPIGWRHDNRQLLGFIERLLKGCENQRISGVQIPMQSPFFLVFGVDMVSAPGDSDPDVEKAAHTELHVCDVLSETFSAHYFWPMNIDGRLICVVNLKPDPENPMQTDAMEQVVKPLLQQAVCRLQDEQIQIRIATSGLTVGVDSLSVAYQDTIEIFEQLVLCRPDHDLSILVVNPRSHGTSADHVTRSQTERLFSNYITAQDYENAEQALLKLTEYEAASQQFSVLLKRLTCNRLWWTIDVLSSVLTDDQRSRMQEIIGRISDAEYLDVLKAGIHDCFVILRENSAPENQDALIPRVIRYIREHCTDADLNVNLISEHFGVNASYLSNTFHNQVGTKLIDYIHQQRILKIRQLLKDTDLSIAEIAEKTGYYSAMSMSRAFKRYEGITPSAYRNAN